MNYRRHAGTPFGLSAMIGAVLLGFLMGRQARAEQPHPPNIILILLDNVGWGELGSYGGGALRGAPTPNLDALAGEGLRLTNFNVEDSCMPTRSALMTGRFSVRTGNQNSSSSGIVGWEVTFPQLLKQKGYATGHFGKWHLGNEEGRYPTSFGFDEWYGIPRTSNEALNEISPGYNPAIVEPMYILEGKAGSPSKRDEIYDVAARRNIDADLVDRAIAFAGRNLSSKQPFFAYVPMTQVHFPSIPSATFKGRSGYGDFADSMIQTDSLVGKLVHAVDEMGASENTLIIVASDNGPEYRQPWRGSAGPWASTMHTMMEGGLRAPAILRWPGMIKPGVSDSMVHAVDLFNTLAHVGGASVPQDRPIDGVDQFAFFTGASPHSAREGFPIYIDGKLYGAKFRDWKYHIQWRPDASKPPEKLATPYLFNVTLDPKEETPRTFGGANSHLEDYWVLTPIQKMIRTMEVSLAANPPVPYGAPVTYVPKPAPVRAGVQE